MLIDGSTVHFGLRAVRGSVHFCPARPSLLERSPWGGSAGQCQAAGTRVFRFQLRPFLDA